MSPAIVMALIHLFEDQRVLDRVREEIQETYGQCPASEFDMQGLPGIPLLHSMYAETLRLHATSYTLVSAPDNEVLLGKWRLPKGGIGLISPEICHMDQNFWNTRGGLHPLHTFWAERFVTNPGDPLSGPVLPGVAAKPPTRGKKHSSSDTKPYVSMKGLEGSWMPYSGTFYDTYPPLPPQLCKTPVLHSPWLTVAIRRWSTYLPRSLSGSKDHALYVRSVCFKI